MWHLLPTQCFVGNALSTVFTDPRLALRILLDFLLLCLSGNFCTQSALKPPDSKTFVVWNFHMNSFLMDELSLLSI